MTECIDVRTVGWSNENCVNRVWKEEKILNDWTGEYYTESGWDDRLRCDTRTINAKTDYCKTCNKNLVYP